MNNKEPIKTFLNQINESIGSTKAIVVGGKEFEKLSLQILQVCVSDIEIYSGGALVVPQLGDEAGNSKLIDLSLSKECSCIRLNSTEKINKHLWETGRNLPQEVKIKCDHEESHLLHLFNPIALGFELDHPIGYYWLLIEEKYAEDARIALQSATNFLGLLVLVVKSTHSLIELSKPIRGEAETTDKVVRDIAESCQRALATTGVIVWLKNESNTLKTIYSVGNFGIINVDMKVGNGVGGKCAESNKTLYVNDLLNLNELHSYGISNVEHPNIVKDYNLRSAIFVPLDIGDEIIGVISAYSNRPRGFSEFEKNIVQAFAKQLSAGYVRSRRITELSEMEKRINIEAPAIEAGRLAIDEVHDLIGVLNTTQDLLSNITSRFSTNKNHPIRIKAFQASENVDIASKIIRGLTNPIKANKIILSNTNISEFITETIDRKRWDGEKEGISFKVNYQCPKDLKVRLDRGRLQRILLNLLDNSIYWLETDNKPGQREIIVTIEYNSQSLVLRVKDSGPGISPNDEPKLFNKFFTTRGDRGMGFGLSIVKRLVEEMKGEIKMNTKWGYFTEFVIKLPIAV